MGRQPRARLHERIAGRPSMPCAWREPSWRPHTPQRSGWRAGPAFSRSMPLTKTIIGSRGLAMSNQRKAQPAADLSLDVLRSYLSDNARRELDTLRTSLDARLGALEDALAHPERQASLEALVLDLA